MWIKFKRSIINSENIKGINCYEDEYRENVYNFDLQLTGKYNPTINLFSVKKLNDKADECLDLIMSRIFESIKDSKSLDLGEFVENMKNELELKQER